MTPIGKDNLVLAKMELFNVVLHEDLMLNEFVSSQHRHGIGITIRLLCTGAVSCYQPKQDLKHACLLVFANKQVINKD